MKPVDPNEAARLTVLDRSLLLPQRDRRLETFCLQADGSYTIETEILTPENPIVYPDNTVGVWPKPKYARSVNQNGLVSYYNAVGEKIDEELLNGSAAVAVFKLVEAFQATKDYPLDAADDEVTDQLLNAMQDQGFTITDQGNEVVSFMRTHPDGRSNIVLIDKDARMQIGQMSLDAEGQAIGGYILRVSGQAPNVTLEEMLEITYFQAVESKVVLQRIQATVYHDCALNF
jgi:hypothetical protein